MSPCHGIDLGTTASAIGRVVDGHPTLYAMGDGPLLPSAVAYLPDGRVLVGSEALHAAPLHPGRVIRSAKRHMGTDHVYTLPDGRTVTPVDVAAAVLGALADTVERTEGTRPERVVITVPAWFTQAQRADTRRAGEQAGLEVVRLINEPTAAALAHAHGQPGQRRALVYDFGGGTFDVSLVDQDGPILEVRASHGDTRLGGDDVDAALLDHVLTRIDDTDPALAQAVRDDGVARVRLAEAVEAAKIRLCSEARTHLALPFLTTVDGTPRGVELELEREDLEEIVMPLVKRTAVSVDRVLSDAGVRPDDIDVLLFVGGSTALPQVFQGLRHRYGLEGSAAIPPRQAVALGAAIQAAIVDGSRVDGVLVDVAPYALSIGSAAGGIPGYPTHFVCDVVTPRNAPLPARHTHLVRTGHPEQARIRLPVYQGSHPDPRRNVILGEIVMEDLPPAPGDRLFRPIAVTFAHDLDGVVTITLTDQLTGTTAQGTVAADGGEVEALRQRWADHVETHELTWGDPLTPDDDSPRTMTGDAAPPEAVEARRLFDAVLERRETLPDEAADLADEILDTATAGALAFQASRFDEVTARHEDLQDLLFEAGVYL